jgi:hypothetical protein
MAASSPPRVSFSAWPRRPHRKARSCLPASRAWLPGPCRWRPVNMSRSARSPTPSMRIWHARAASWWTIRLRARRAGADLSGARRRGRACAAGGRPTHGQGRIGRPCARRAGHFGDNDGAPGAGRARLRGDVLHRSATPLALVLLSPTRWILPVVAAGSLLSLAVLGMVGARAGGATLLKPTVRVTFWGAFAMALTAGIGALVGKAV